MKKKNKDNNKLRLDKDNNNLRLDKDNNNLILDEEEEDIRASCINFDSAEDQQWIQQARWFLTRWCRPPYNKG